MKEDILKDFTDAQDLIERVIALAFHYPLETCLISATLIIAFKIFLKNK